MVYAIYNADKSVFKFGVSDASLNRYYQVIKDAPIGSYGTYTKTVLTKQNAHRYEKYLRTLYYNSTEGLSPTGMKIPFPIDINTGKIIKP